MRVRTGRDETTFTTLRLRQAVLINRIYIMTILKWSVLMHGFPDFIDPGPDIKQVCRFRLFGPGL